VFCRDAGVANEAAIAQSALAPGIKPKAPGERLPVAIVVRAGWRFGNAACRTDA
jgi:hypothetical protein